MGTYICRECDRGVLVLHRLEPGFPLFGFQCACDDWMTNFALLSPKMIYEGKPKVRPKNLPIYNSAVHPDYVRIAPFDDQLRKWFETAAWKHPDFLKALQFYPGRDEIMLKYKRWQEDKDALKHAQQRQATDSEQADGRPVLTPQGSNAEQHNQSSEASL